MNIAVFKSKLVKILLLQTTIRKIHFGIKVQEGLKEVYRRYEDGMKEFIGSVIPEYKREKRATRSMLILSLLLVRGPRPDFLLLHFMSY